MAMGMPTAYTWNTSRGATGVSSAVSVMNRYPAPGAEVYCDVMRNMSGTRSDGHPAGLAWEIAEDPVNPTGVFYPVMDVYYYDDDTSYPDDRYICWYPYSVSTGTHTLEIRQDTPNISTTWDLCIDGVLKYNNVWWPYYNNNTEMTMLEYGGDFGANPYAFFGRHDNIRLRTSTGVWSLQTAAAWDNRISQAENAYLFYISNTEPYENWCWIRW